MDDKNTENHFLTLAEISSFAQNLLPNILSLLVTKTSSTPTIKRS